MNEKRRLNFTDLDQVSAELNRLLSGGYTQSGNWNLSQICGHLDDWMRYSLDGYPKAAAPLRLLFRLIRITVGRRQFESVIKHGFKANLPTMPATVPKPDARSDGAAVAQLTETVSRLNKPGTPVVPSPLYGALTWEETVQLQLAHCSHHLSFLTPKDAAAIER